ncbi:hypothetical protein KVA01_09950 [Kocuria varians]|uniref:DUF304 domain-containing protein n=1 Tax=Kocuria varians TaxID=1272 RepID=A0A4Y4D7W9_KOCVA|nr:hypothetical protein [Kocuria varians]GEC98840.1 hypothetical protein KVA01_09950 [Kocuria varians]
MENPQQRLQPHLRPGEKLLWSGQPDPRVHFMPFDAFFVPFSILWCAFAVWWTWRVSTDAGPRWWSPLFGLLFVAMGLLYLVFGRFIVKARRKRRTVYGLTDTRAIVVEGDRRVSDVRVKDEPAQVRKNRDGVHVEVVFGGAGLQTAQLNSGMEIFSPGRPSPVAFFDVADGEALLRELNRVR